MKAANNDIAMITWIFLCSIAFVSCSSNSTTPSPVEQNDTSCYTCLKVNQTCFNVTYLFDLEAPYRDHIVIKKLGILKSTNTLFFSFEPAISDPEYYKVGFVYLDTPSNASIIYSEKQLLNFGTFDIDQDNGIVYLGGSNGVYVLDTKLNRVTPYSSRGDKVLNIVYKGNIYFVRDEEFKIVKKKGDNFEILIDDMTIKNFVMNKYNVIVYLSTDGLFVRRQKEMVLLSNNPFFRGLAIDLEDVIYAWWIDGIYKIDIGINLTHSKITKVADIPDIGALTFDTDNHIMFTSGKSLYKLIETNETAC